VGADPAAGGSSSARRHLRPQGTAKEKPMHYRAVILKLIIALTALLAACVSRGMDQRSNYGFHDTIADLDFSGNHAIAVAVCDRREAIRSRTKPPHYVGYYRETWGTIHDVVTATGRQLAADISRSVELTLRYHGFRTIGLPAEPAESQSAILQKFKQTRAQRWLLLEIKQWESRTYWNTTVAYDLALTVFDFRGKRLAGQELKGENELEGSLAGPSAYAKIVVPELFKHKLEGLLNSYQIAAALH
jgi:hypothetical protein